MFADDLIIFCKAESGSLNMIMNALNQFHTTTSLKANLHKSQMVIGGASSELHYQCLRATGFQGSHLLLKYLKVPITAGRLTKIECSNLVDKIIARVHGWATRHLSFVGGALLINSVIFGSFNY